jgi:hypothetical protein
MCCPNGSKKLLAQKILASQNVGGRMDFLHEVHFFAGIGPAHFPAVTTRPLGRGCLPFSPLCFNVFCHISLLFRFPEMDAANIIIIFHILNPNFNQNARM